MSDELRPVEPAAPGPDTTLASDAEREATVARLGDAAGEGRLILEEFSERVGRAYAARTRGELQELVQDLPEPAGSTPTAPVRAAPTGHTDWHVALLGGFRRVGRWRVSQQITSISLIGGMRLDLREAEFAAPDVMLTKVSLIGGARLTVPPGVRVEVTNFSLIGGRRTDADERLSPNAPTLHLRAFSLIGGVRVQRTPRRERERR
jgi:hypothetical protein